MKYLLLLTLLACNKEEVKSQKYMADLSALKKIIINSEKGRFRITKSLEGNKVVCDKGKFRVDPISFNLNSDDKFHDCMVSINEANLTFKIKTNVDMAIDDIKGNLFIYAKKAVLFVFEDDLSEHMNFIVPKHGNFIFQEQFKKNISIKRDGKKTNVIIDVEEGMLTLASPLSKSSP
jgi:hypothetical protein